MTSSASATATFEKIDPNDPKFVDCTDAVELNKYANHAFKVMKDIDLAELLYTKAIKLDPSNVDICFNYANMLEKARKEYDLAERCYKEAPSYTYIQ